jgi:hypothetical protein
MYEISRPVKHNERRCVEMGKKQNKNTKISKDSGGSIKEDERIGFGSRKLEGPNRPSV